MQEKREQKSREQRPIPIVSRRTRGGEIVEMLFERETGKTSFAVGGTGTPSLAESIEENGRTYVPYSATNNLLTHRVLLLPSDIGDSQEVVDILNAVRAFIHRYVDLPSDFEEIAAHYVLLTWLHDCWNELPYLRVRGDFGSGKSRFLLTVGSICWKPLFASGASTVSPIFRLLDEVGGTLVIDEADFWQSDEKAEIVKILNNGNARGFPVLRTDVNAAKEFSPRAFNIFGPKIIATRHPFEDEALESRCLSAVLGRRSPRADIPVSLPSEFEAEAEQLRNILLRYRLERAVEGAVAAPVAAAGMTGRRAQIIAPMLAVAVDEETRERLCAFASDSGSLNVSARLRLRREILAVLGNLRAAGVVLSVGAVARGLSQLTGQAWSDRQVGESIRKMGLSTQKSNGVYRIPAVDLPHLDELLRQEGLRDIGEVGDVQADAAHGQD